MRIQIQFHSRAQILTCGSSILSLLSTAMSSKQPHYALAIFPLHPIQGYNDRNPTQRGSLP